MSRPRLSKKTAHLQALIRGEDEAFLRSLGMPISTAFRSLIATDLGVFAGAGCPAAEAGRR